VGAFSDTDARRIDQERRHAAVVDDLDHMPVDEAYSEHDLRTPGGLAYGSGADRWYGPSSPFSFFRDRVTVALDDAARDARWFDDNRVAALLGDNLPTSQHGTAEDARNRLATSSEKRALTTTATAGGNFVPPGPSYIADMFATFARAASKMTTILPVEPLPEKGIFSLTTPRLTTGDAVAVQATQNTSVGTVDFVESNVPNPVATISGYVDMSQQLMDHSEPAMADAVIARELGRALGTAADVQILAGTGGSGQMLGLGAVTGIVANTYVDATSTQAEAWPTICKLYGDVSTAVGDSATAILVHPRRRAWLLDWKDSATGMQSNLNWPTTPYEVPAISTTAGAGTEDIIYALRVEELPIYMTDPVFQVALDQSGANTFTVRIRVYQYVSALFSRRPEAVGKLSGTGLIAPVYS
jgi:hypothetical protein